ncbi:DUF421 domain-containing protein [Bacillus sp. 165]|uniref:DUF421 domain-containing protein n=1 Tax=Bacillus sp. 165 TaxID=1529117 RepID=UPI001ADBB0C2|nr:DUF421 domain-containing protein [Bacillus sp. 165]MBO9130476.1 DUF421 domain-containing protein [Bacillus sp. 165]
MEVFPIIIRTFFVYCVILFIFRLMGKREIGELSILDLVVFIMIAELAVIAIEDPKLSIIHAMLPMFILMLVQIILAMVSLKSQKVRKILDGEPVILIKEGKIDEKQMKKQRYNFDDLLLQLREKEIGDIRDVEYAILEPSGKLSVFEKDRSLKKWMTKPKFSLPLIIDGVIQEDHLAMIEQTNLWLRQKLRNLGYKDVRQISYCTLQDGEFFVDIKDE